MHELSRIRHSIWHSTDKYEAPGFADSHAGSVSPKTPSCCSADKWEALCQRQHYAVLQTNGKSFAKDITLSCTREALFHQTNGKHIAKNIICHLTDNLRNILLKDTIWHSTNKYELALCQWRNGKHFAKNTVCHLTHSWETLCQRHRMAFYKQMGTGTMPVEKWEALCQEHHMPSNRELRNTLPKTLYDILQTNGKHIAKGEMGSTLPKTPCDIFQAEYEKHPASAILHPIEIMGSILPIDKW